MSRTPSHCVLIARHINCPQHDEPARAESMHRIYGGFPALVEYIAQGIGEYRILEILDFDTYSPKIRVTETYEHHNVCKVVIEFDTEIASSWFLGPWTHWAGDTGFRDREDIGLDPERIADAVETYIKHGISNEAKAFDLMRSRYAELTAANKTTVRLHSGDHVVYAHAGPTKLLGFDHNDTKSIVCSSLGWWGVSLGSWEGYEAEFAVRIQEAFPDERDHGVILTRELVCFEHRADAERLFDVMNSYFEKRIPCVIYDNLGLPYNENM